MTAGWAIEEELVRTATLKVFVGATQVPAGTRWLVAQGNYTHVAPSASDVLIPISNAVLTGPADLSPIANRQVVGELLVGQRVDAMATTGSAVKYTLAGSINASGVLDAVYLSSPFGTVGPGTGPTVTLIVAAPNMTMRFYNPSLTGNVTGCFELKYGWAT